ncbi:MAG TPA: non-canonical purine NTP pyrophosphatase [Gemmatimonadaceae bacterium]|nr:non-canonical purine NTP pyrophosphatase [Gemmatimonadaceae bacterium]
MTGRDVLVATRSPGKMRELRPLLEGAGFTVVDLATFGLPEEPEEQGIECHDTFEANALAKARYFYEVSGGIATVADDSGLEVYALGGAPGVRSKRFSGRDDLSGEALDAANNAALLAALSRTDDRRARYVCAAAFVAHDEEVIERGESAGRIIDAPRGVGGFGYDPYFESAELERRTFAEVGVSEKEAVSHRGRAFRALLTALERVGG